MKHLYFVIVLFLLCGCSSFLEEYSQDKAYIQSYEDLDELLLGNAYLEKFNGGSWEMTGVSGNQYYAWVHFIADELQQVRDGFYWSSNGPGWAGFGYYTWQYRVDQDPEGNITWNEDSDFQKLYAHINACNMILEEAKAFENSKDEVIQENVNRIKGECFFLRGSYYFLLANFYGKPYETSTAATDPAVPLKLSPYVEDIYFQRNSVADVYEQVEKDLLEAEHLLKDVPKKSIYRADVHAARLMLSRMYLYMCDYEKAVEYASLVTTEGPALEDLNGFGGTDEMTGLAIDFLNPNLSELIFSTGLAPFANNVATDNLRLIMQYGNSFQISNELYQAYAPETSHDLRLQHYVVSKSGYIAYKKLANSLTATLEMSDVFLMRTSEAYLNLAEAAACAGDEATARTALKTLREKRIDATYYSPAELEGLSGEELVHFIREERRRELCLEGHRWFDLRRYRVAAQYPEEITLEHIHINKSLNMLTGTFEIEWERKYTLPSDDPAWVLPIPRNEIEKNTGMINNPRNERTYENIY